MKIDSYRKLVLKNGQKGLTDIEYKKLEKLREELTPEEKLKVLERLKETHPKIFIRRRDR